MSFNPNQRFTVEYSDTLLAQLQGSAPVLPSGQPSRRFVDEKAGYDLGFINKALYHIGQAQKHYSASFHDVTSGTNSALEFDTSNNPVTVMGFNAGPGWDATTGLGSPTTDQLANYLVQFVSPGDGTAAVAGSKPHTNGKPSAPGHMKPH